MLPDANNEQTPPAPKRRGFANMSPERLREVARRGGQAAHKAGTAHEFTSEKAREAGRKGGLATQRHRRPAAEQPPAPESTPEPAEQAAPRH